MPRLRQRCGILHRLQFLFAAHEPGVPACRGALEACAQRPRPGDFIDFQWLADPLDACRSQRFQSEIALDQLAHGFANRDRAGCRESLEAGGDAGRVPYRRVLGLLLARPNLTQHYLSVLAPTRTWRFTPFSARSFSA